MCIFVLNLTYFGDELSFTLLRSKCIGCIVKCADIITKLLFGAHFWIIWTVMCYQTSTSIHSNTSSLTHSSSMTRRLLQFLHLIFSIVPLTSELLYQDYSKRWRHFYNLRSFIHQLTEYKYIIIIDFWQSPGPECNRHNPQF